jgi:hypothetical protein
MAIAEFIVELKKNPTTVSFTDVINLIDTYYDFTPVTFTNGNVINEAGTNSGSCKLFSFAQIHQLTQQETLYCFGDYYRNDVLLHPNETNHANIRNFIQTGWEGIQFKAQALLLK